jgi:hypothetical protein
MALSSLMRQSCLRAASKRALYTCFYVLDIRFLTRHFLSAGVKGSWVSMRRVGPFHMGVIYYGTRLRRINLILKAMKGWSDQLAVATRTLVLRKRFLVANAFLLQDRLDRLLEHFSQALTRQS